jgi:hypothetical protein
VAVRIKRADRPWQLIWGLGRGKESGRCQAEGR